MNEEKKGECPQTRKSSHATIYGVSRALVTIATKSEKLYGLLSTAITPA